MINPSLQGPRQAPETTAQRGRDTLGGGGGRSSGASCRTLAIRATSPILWGKFPGQAILATLLPAPYSSPW